MKRVIAASAGLAMFGVGKHAEAAPVTIEARGNIATHTNTGSGGGNYIPGNASVGDVATIRITYDVNPSDVVSVSDGGYQYTLGAITSYVLSVNGQEFEFVNANLNGNHLVQIDDASNSVNNNDQISLSTNEHNNAYQTSQSADVLFEYSADTFSPGFNLSVPIANLVSGSGSFTIYGDGTDYSNITVNFDNVRLANNVAVPTPAAFGASALLLPMLLRRKQTGD